MKLAKRGDVVAGLWVLLEAWRLQELKKLEPSDAGADLGTPAERVARGAALLDVVSPGWAKWVTLPILDGLSVGECIFGSGSEFVDYMGQCYPEVWFDLDWFGFTIGELADEWRAAILERKLHYEVQTIV